MLYEAKFYKETPSTKDKNFIVTEKGGYSHCIDRGNGYTLPNCVAMVHGQWLYQATSAFAVDYAKELESRLCRKNAEAYWGYTSDGLERGSEPRRGAIICWRKGSASSSKDGAGHVAIVRDVHPNGDVTCIASNYSGSKFYVGTYRKAKNYYLGSTYTFQGFIYLPFEIADFVTVPVDKDTTRPQIEVTISNLNVRTGHSTKEHRQGYCAVGYYNILETYHGMDYTWYRISDENLWVAKVDGVTAYIPQYDVEVTGVAQDQLPALESALNEMNLKYNTTYAPSVF